VNSLLQLWRRHREGLAAFVTLFTALSIFLVDLLVVPGLVASFGEFGTAPPALLTWVAAARWISPLAAAATVSGLIAWRLRQTALATVALVTNLLLSALLVLAVLSTVVRLADAAEEHSPRAPRSLPPRE
jgi:hypothetical protein